MMHIFVHVQVSLMVDIAAPAHSEEEGNTDEAQRAHDTADAAELAAVDRVYTRGLEHVGQLAAARDTESMPRTRDPADARTGRDHEAPGTRLSRGRQLFEARLRAEWAAAVAGQEGRSLARSHASRAQALERMHEALAAAPDDLQVQVWLSLSSRPCVSPPRVCPTQPCPLSAFVRRGWDGEGHEAPACIWGVIVLRGLPSVPPWLASVPPCLGFCAPLAGFGWLWLACAVSARACIAGSSVELSQVLS